MQEIVIDDVVVEPMNNSAEPVVTDVTVHQLSEVEKVMLNNPAIMQELLKMHNKKKRPVVSKASKANKKKKAKISQASKRANRK